MFRGCDHTHPCLHVFGIHLRPALKTLSHHFAFADSYVAVDPLTVIGSPSL
jgi:hypothetical protein